jgi:MFS family permease
VIVTWGRCHPLAACGALHFNTADRQWVVTANTLAFGSLLLLGGRLADLLGRKLTFLAGLVGFAGVSAVGGASVSDRCCRWRDRAPMRIQAK